ncbi:putative 3-oxolaurate decarboxylase [Medicago truncatula]|uniref:Alpha/beta fold hydrolase n=1 Tax=Medicago truncatula TaxID=3880 RepID=A0A072TWQ1_MEDTR|nr:salicylic acid-binding protein 2 isoform X1 [Medicago truncatula]KEH17955.1 alpha/beta fold hydrolase [Medicago truncatula]RHN38732.1 putative 3-oxolaurate decarboxylase [Medicago truncatula]
MFKQEKHFVLIHGGIHGAWCWYKVATDLKSAGHKVTALDMAACGTNPKQMQEVHSISEYHQPLMTFMESLPLEEKVVLVGHSLGGLSVSIAMENYPHKIFVAVFITATVVTQNLTYPAFLQERRRRVGSILDKQNFIVNGPDKAPILSSNGLDLLASRMYQLSPSQDLTLALSLVRPLPPFLSDADLLMKQTTVTNENNGMVPKIFIISENDNLQTKDFQEWIIETTGPYAKVKMIEGSDHMVMLSNPTKLSSELLNISYNY